MDDQDSIVIRRMMIEYEGKVDSGQENRYLFSIMMMTDD